MMRVCKTCNVSKPDDSYGKVTNRGVVTRRGSCKECCNAASRAKNAAKAATVSRDAVPKPAACDVCRRACSDAVDFHWRSDLVRWRTTCISCMKASNAAKAVSAVTPTHRVCETCGIDKPDADFSKTPNGNLRTECKACRTDRSKAAVAERAPIVDRESVPRPAACGNCGRGAHEPGVEFKWRSDMLSEGWRSTCNACYNEKNYSENFRERERAKDETAYLKRNAETHIAWARKNPDKVARQQELGKRLPERRIKQVESSAKARDIDFVGADRDAMAAKLRDPCFYCAYAPNDGDKLNGLDRVYSFMPYSDANTVPCCGCCNGMKSIMDVDEFVHLVRRICSHQGMEPLSLAEAQEKRERSPCLAGKAEACAKTKEKRMLLDEDQQLALKCAPCYLCGVTFSCGLDRVDSDGDYTVDNTRPCCSPCNYMKKHLSLDEFKKHLAYVLTHTATWVLKDVSNVCTIIGKQRQAISALDTSGEPLIVFPSILTAAKMIKVDPKAITYAIANNTRCHGHHWSESGFNLYKQQVLDSEAAMTIVAMLSQQ